MIVGRLAAATVPWDTFFESVPVPAAGGTTLQRVPVKTAGVSAGSPMSVIRPKPPEHPIEYEPADAAAVRGRLPHCREAVETGLSPAPEQVRQDVLGDADVTRPDRILDAYNTGGGRAGSELFAILQAARRIRDTVDRVIVLGQGCGPLGARAIFESCAHPRHNELSRGERGGRPRLSFVDSCLDNDAIQGLLDLVAPPGKPRGGDLLDRWAVVVTDATGDDSGTAAATRLFVAALLESVSGDRAALADRLVPIAMPGGGLAGLASALGCTSVFTRPDDAGEAGAVFTAVGLLPAAIVGIDVVRLLQGAAAINRRFREAPVSENPVLQYAGVAASLGERAGMTRGFASRSSQLDALGRWHGGVAMRQELSRTMPSTISTITNLVASEPRRDPLVVPPLAGCAGNEDGWDCLVGTSWPELLDSAGPRPSGDTIRLPRIDEHSIGQLLQFVVLADLVAGRREFPSRDRRNSGV